MRKLYFVKICIFVVQVDSKLLSDLVQIKILEKEDNFSIKGPGSLIQISLLFDFFFFSFDVRLHIFLFKNDVDSISCL